MRALPFVLVAVAAYFLLRAPKPSGNVSVDVTVGPIQRVASTAVDPQPTQSGTTLPVDAGSQVQDQPLLDSLGIAYS